MSVVKGMKNTLLNPKVKSVLIEILESDESGIEIQNEFKDFGFFVHSKSPIKSFGVLYNYIFQR